MAARLRLLLRHEVTGGAQSTQIVEAVWQGYLPRALAPPRFRPPVDLCETGEAVHVRIDVAGVDETTLSATFHGGVLAVEGERPWAAVAPDARVHLSEIAYGPFRVAVSMPAAIDEDKVEATYEHGFVEVTLPKRRRS